MKTKSESDLLLACYKSAREAATKHAEFAMSGNRESWFSDHKDELLSAFEHYAELGALAAFRLLKKESKP